MKSVPARSMWAQLRGSCAVLAAVLILDPASARAGVGVAHTGSGSARVSQQQSSDPDDLRYEFASTDAALRESLPQGAHFVLQAGRLDATQRAQLQQQLRRRVVADLEEVYLAYGSDEAFVGYAVVTEEIGKYRPITMLITVTPDGKVEEVQVLVYRESRGMDVRRSRFLRQFKNKDSGAAFRLGQDIVNVTGATLSARAVTLAVRRVLATLHTVYDGVPPSLAEARAASTDAPARQRR